MKRIVAVMATVCVLLLSSFSVSAQTDAKTQLEKTLKGVKTEFEASFNLEDSDPNKAYPDMWYVYPLCATGKTSDSDYQFLIPKYDNPETSNALMKSIMTDLLLRKTPNVKQVSALKEKQAENGAFQNSYGYDSVTETAYAMIALKLADKDWNADKAIEYLKSAKKEDGGYNDYGAEGSVDTTGMVMSGLAVVGEKGELLNDAKKFILSTEKEDGSLVGTGMYDSANSCSQSMGIIGLIAAGENMDSHSKIVENLFSYLDENGCFWYDEDSKSGRGWYQAPDMFSTYQGMMALADLGYGNVFMSLLPQEPTTTVPTTTIAPTTNSNNDQPTTSQSIITDNSMTSPETGAPDFPMIYVFLAIAAVVVLVAVIVITVVSKKNKK